MENRLKFKLGENNTIPTKKKTEPVKYDLFDPNISDEDEDLEDLETANNIHFAKPAIKKTSLAFKMQMMNQEKQKNVIMPQGNSKIYSHLQSANNEDDEPLSATKNIHKRYRYKTTDTQQQQKMESIDEVSPTKEFDQRRKRVMQFEDAIAEEKKKEPAPKPGQFRKGSETAHNNQHPLDQFENQNSEIKADELEKQKKLIENLDQNNFKHPFKHLIFSKNITERQFKRYLALVYRGLIYSKKCLKSPSEKFIQSKQIKLPQPTSSIILNQNSFPLIVKRFKTLFLDLDETLVHSCTIKENPEKIITATNDYGDEATLGLNIRPYCQELLDILSQYYEIFIFTASSPNYANAIIKVLDPFEKYILGILTRENCMETKNGFFIKDLRIIKNREMKNMVLVDNLSHSFGFQIDNGIPILEWHNDQKDQELKYLIDYLVAAAFVANIPDYNREHLRINELASCTPQELQFE